MAESRPNVMQFVANLVDVICNVFDVSPVEVSSEVFELTMDAAQIPTGIANA